MEALLLDRYEVLGSLGSGGFGEVLHAFDMRMEREVAIKRLPKSPRTTSRALTEARTIALLNHPNIVTVYDFDQDQEHFYLVMEVVEGTPLSQILSSTRLSVEEAVAVGLQIAHALECAHYSDIVHRDIKPGNIMLLRDGRIKVVDFGVARLMGSRASSDGMIVGTPGYASPEQSAGEMLDDRSDLFSLAVVLYQMLAGTRPFEAETDSAATYKVMNSQPRHPNLVSPEIHERLGDAVMRALEKEPDNRYDSVTELRYKLERWSGEERPEVIVRRLLARIEEPGAEHTWGAAVPKVDNPVRVIEAALGAALLGVTLFLFYGQLAGGLPKSAVLAGISLLAGGGLIAPSLALPLLVLGMAAAVAWVQWWLVLPGLALGAAYYHLWHKEKPLPAMLPFAAPIIANLGIGLSFPILVAYFAGVRAAAAAAILGAIGLSLYDAAFSEQFRFLQFASPQAIEGLSGNTWRATISISSAIASNNALLIQPLLWGFCAALAAAGNRGRGRLRLLTYATSMVVLLYGYYFLSAFSSDRPDVFWAALKDWVTALPLVLLLALLGPRTKHPPRERAHKSGRSEYTTGYGTLAGTGEKA